ncbi:DUF4345 domain-containing protein [Nocardioides sp. HDW12B]|nr:DUF4345 domain-containing protein [Nocardioides sp. HDW12B]
MHPGIVVGSVFYTGVGLTALVRPALVPSLFGGRAPTATARTEIRAVYGGLPLAMAGLVLSEAGGRDGGRRASRTEAVAALSAAMAAGRLLGSWIEGEADGITRLFTALEAATAAALLLGAGVGPAGHGSGPDERTDNVGRTTA